MIFVFVTPVIPIAMSLGCGGLYVYGITLKGLELKDDARRILLESVQAFPCHWSAWLDIISILSSQNQGRMDQRMSKPLAQSLVV